MSVRAKTRLGSAVAAVREAIFAQQDQGIDWSAVLEALDGLDALCSARSPVRRRRGLKPLPENVYVAVIAVDQRIGSYGPRASPERSQIMTQLVKRIAQCPLVRLGRVNGARIELAVFAPDRENAEQHLAALQRELERPIRLSSGLATIATTIGFAAAADLELQVAVEWAERALHKAISGHLRLSSFAEADEARHLSQVQLVRDLRDAPDAGQLFVHFQPKLSLRTGQVSGLEALVRWKHPERGFITPDNFIGLAEEANEIRPLTEFVVKQALQSLKDWPDQQPPVPVAVNLSGRLVSDPDFADWVISEAGDLAERLWFEITETAIFSNPTHALLNLRRLAAAGIGLSIDDYGSGLSSLTYLKEVPARELKIDRSFVANLTSSHRDPLLVRSTIDLAHALGMEVAAEGVEDAMTMALLKVMGCDTAQGYHICTPLGWEGLKRFLSSYSGCASDLEPSGEEWMRVLHRSR